MTVSVPDHRAGLVERLERQRDGLRREVFGRLAGALPACPWRALARRSRLAAGCLLRLVATIEDVTGESSTCFSLGENSGERHLDRELVAVVVPRDRGIVDRRGGCAFFAFSAALASDR